MPDEKQYVITSSVEPRIKKVETDRYKITFNMATGREELEGINGHPDPFSLDYPSLMDIGIMGHCSNRCEFCYQGDDQKPNMSLENFKRIVDESKEYVNQIALGGRGSPNEHENFKEIVEYCIKNDIIPNYTTSGLNLTDEQIEISKMCGAVAVSDYEQDYTYSAINRFINAGIKTNIHFLLSKKTFLKAIGILFGDDMWAGRVNTEKLNAIVFLLFKPQGRAKNLDWIINTDGLKAFCHGIFDKKLAVLRMARKMNFKLGMDSCLVNKVKKSGVHLTRREEESMDTCEGARMSMYISPDMRMIPCSFGGNEYGIPLEGKTIKEVWNNSDIFKKFREQLLKDPACCPFEL